MTRKKVIIISIGLLILTGLSIGAYWYFSNKNKPVKKVSFEFEKPENIEKIIITDAYSNSFTLIKSNGKWTDDKGNCVMQEGVDNILDAAKNIRFKAYLSKKAEENFNKQMKTNNTKVEFFENGLSTKTWYIGPSAQDHYGQIMVLDAPNMSPTKPVIMEIRNMRGIIQPRFFTDPKLWMCTNIFSYEAEEIKSVSIQFPNETYRNFKISNKGNLFEVSSNNERLQEIDTMNVYRYLQAYKKINFESANYTLNKKQIDSLKSSTPFCILELKDKANKVKQLKMFRIKVESPQENEFGQLVNMDLNRFWCELNNGEIVKCQYFVFNKLLYGNVYFPIMELNENFPKELRNSP
jgi:hypothetical protein